MSRDISICDQPLFNPAHPLSCLLRPARYKILYGGRGSGKSYGTTEALVRIADDALVDVLCTREIQNSIAESVYKTLISTIDRLGMQSRFKTTQTSIQSKRTGSMFSFKGLAHNIDAIKSTEGIHICLVEEAEHVSHNSWEVLIPTIREEDSELWVVFNTGAVTDATYQRFIVNPPPDSVIYQINYDQNPFFPEVLRREMEYLKSIDYERYEHIWLGKPLEITDDVIFKDRVVIEEFDTDEDGERFYYGMDFGYSSDPYAVIRCYEKDTELFIDQERGGYHIELDELVPLAITMPGMRKRPKIYADSSLPGNISYLNNNGLYVEGAKKYAGSVEDGIRHIKAYSKIHIHPRCKCVIYEFRNYKWKVDQTTKEILPIPIDKNNHYVDALRYALSKQIEQKNSLQRFAALAPQQRT